jgi:hypothetical protein
VLPDWPADTVAILATAGEGPHAIPVSAVVRAGEREILIGLASRRGSLERLRAQPRVAVALIARDLAITAHGTAEVLDAELSDGVVAVAITVETLSDHLRPTFAIEAGVRWGWTDAEAQARDASVRTALARLAGTR